MGVSVYREQEEGIFGWRPYPIQRAHHELKIANRELGTVESIAPDGAMR